MSRRTDAWNSPEHNSAEYMHWVLRRLSYLAEGKPIDQVQALILAVIDDQERWEHSVNLIADEHLKELHLFAIRASKGMVKAWRTYLINREHQPAESSPVPRPPTTAN